MAFKYPRVSSNSTISFLNKLIVPIFEKLLRNIKKSGEGGVAETSFSGSTGFVTSGTQALPAIPDALINCLDS